jgi:hypothetical protein
MKTRTPLFLFCVAALILQSAPASPAGPDSGPAVGAIAPEHGLSDWLQKADGAPPKLSDLRGQVVILHTFAWNCATCLKVGIPLAVDLLAANADRGLRVISITTPANRDDTLAVVRERHLTHSVALENPFQSACPYVKIPLNPITYMFVIGRSGEVAWRGDPSRNLKACLEAVQKALIQPPGRFVEDHQHPVLSKAVQEFREGNLEAARVVALKMLKAQAKAKGSETAASARVAEQLIQRIDGIAEALVKDLDAAIAAKDALKYVTARDDLRRSFPKSDIVVKAREKIEAAERDAEFAARATAAAEWRELERQRPALYPVAKDAASKSYAALLKKFAVSIAAQSEPSMCRLRDPRCWHATVEIPVV